MEKHHGQVKFRIWASNLEYLLDQIQGQIRMQEFQECCALNNGEDLSEFITYMATRLKDSIVSLYLHHIPVTLFFLTKINGNAIFIR